MIPDYSDRSKDLQERLLKFMDNTVYPNEDVYQEQLDSAAQRWSVPPVLEEMKIKAHDVGLWNLFLPESDDVEPMSNLDYLPCAKSWDAPPSWRRA